MTTRHLLLLLLLSLLAAGQWANAEPSARPSPSRPQQQPSSDAAAAAAEQLLSGGIPRASAHLDEAHEQEQEHDGHECGHSLVAHMQEQSVREFQEYARSYNVPTARSRASRRVSDNAQPGTMRINVQYQLSQLSSSQQQAVQRVTDTAVRVVRKFVKIISPLQAALQVRNSAVCPPAAIPTVLRAGPGKGISGADFVLVVTSQQTSSCPQSSSSTQTAGALAWAMACDYSLDAASFGRPILGVINLCSGALKAASDAAAASSTITGSVVDVLVHELMHALGLSSSMYSTWMWASGGGISSSGGVSYLNTPNARQAAQSLLSCYQLPGLPLEDQGTASSAASHWEYRFFNQELMSPYLLRSSQRQLLTKLTLGALQDTGWYTTRSAYAQRLDLEQLPASSLGCSLALNSCTAFQSQFPGAYYCNNLGSEAKTPIKAPASGTKQSPAANPSALTPPPSLQCFTPSTPAACDSTPFSNGCGVLRSSPISCSATNFDSFIPSGAVNQMSGIPGVSTDSSFYQGLGAYYGTGGRCLSWYNSSGSSFAGCFDAPRCDGSGRPTVLAVVGKALVTIPCAAGSSVLLSPSVPVKDTGTSLTCPSPSQAAAICFPTPPGYCRNGGACSRGTCSPEGTCVCDLEYMGPSCSVHVSQVTDFDSLSVSQEMESDSLSASAIGQPLTKVALDVPRPARTGDDRQPAAKASALPNGEPCVLSNVEIPLN